MIVMQVFNFKVHMYINELNCGCHVCCLSSSCHQIYFATQERSNKNAINRSHLTYNHKRGSKSLRAHEEEIVRCVFHNFNLDYRWIISY